RRARRSPPPAAASARAASASPRGARAAPPPGRALPRPGSLALPPLARDPPEHAVDEAGRVLRRVPFRQPNRLVDRHFEGDRTSCELVDADPEDVSLHHAEPLGRPALRHLSNPLVELGRLG